MSDKKEILIAKVFCGGYLRDGENIGHEIIDFFDTDNGERYLYIAPDGNVNNHPNVEAVLLIRAHGSTLGEIVGLACDLENIHSSRDEVKPRSITYGGVSVSKIFAENVYQGKADEVFTNPSYRVGSFKTPESEHPIFISIGEAKNNDKRHNLVELNCNELKQLGHQRRYISNTAHPESYARLNELIADEQKWEEQIGEKAVKSVSSSKTKPSFLETIGKEDDELVFSNLLAHYLSCSQKGFNAFAKEVLDINDFGPQPSIIRESKHHVDLWVENGRHIVVIENKIHSAINGIKPGCAETQLSRYREAAETERQNRSVKCYLFAPNSNNIDMDKADEAGFEVKLYSELYDFFKNNKNLFIKDERQGADKFYDEFRYDEFLIGLNRHALTPAERNERTMFERFSYMVDRAKEN